jgi:hypothetical protein
MFNNLPPAAQAFLRRYCTGYIFANGKAVEFTQPDGRTGLRLYKENGDVEGDITWDRDLETNG